MRLIFIALITLFTMLYSSVAYSDIKQDKIVHFMGGFVAQDILVNHGKLNQADAFILILCMGIIKEQSDLQNGRIFDNDDIGFMLLGQSLSIVF